MFGIEKVQIKQTDWHFKWLKFVHFVRLEPVAYYDYGEHRMVNEAIVMAPKSICPYFWLLMWSFLVVMGVGAILFGALLLLAWGLGLVLVYVVHNLTVSIFVVGFVIGIFVFLVAINYLFVLLRKLGRKLGSYEPRQREPRRPGIVMTYLRAKKKKVCPLVEYT